MADHNAISRVTSGAVAPQRGTDLAPAAKRSVAPAGQGAGRREAPNAANRQWVNLDGKQLNKNAPRGTYLNLLV